jgi:hypothetical protein
MSTLTEIRAEIDRATERRAEVWHALSEGHDAELSNELHELEVRTSGSATATKSSSGPATKSGWPGPRKTFGRRAGGARPPALPFLYGVGNDNA